MNVTISKDLKRKTHTPGGEKWKTICGKRIAKTVPTTSDRPGCLVCAVVYDQSIRGIVREMKAKNVNELDKKFSAGFAFALVSFERNWPGSQSQLLSIFQEAGYEINDFKKIDFDETDRIILNQIFKI